MFINNKQKILRSTCQQTDKLKPFKKIKYFNISILLLIKDNFKIYCMQIKKTLF